MLAASMHANRSKRNRKENEIVTGKGKREEHHLSTFNGKPIIFCLANAHSSSPRGKKKWTPLDFNTAAVMTR